MAIDRDHEQSSSSARDAGGTASDALWLLFVLLALGTVAIGYSSSFAAMIEIWSISDTYIHGAVILPISAYLIWLNRKTIIEQSWTPYWYALPVVIGLSVSWWLFNIMGIQAAEHFTAVALIPVMIIGIFGKRVSRRIAFPLAFTLFTVPIGEFLIPALIEYTANFTVFSLSASGIAVIRENQFFSTSAGNFEVAKACSGIRYLLAALTIGTLYAYLNFRTTSRRLAFVLFSFVFPIVANGVRAYLIVLIAHFSDMQLAVGVDHIIFGWIFFGVVIGIMLIVGNHFREVLPSSRVYDKHSYTNNIGMPDRSWQPTIGFVLVAGTLSFTGPFLSTNYASTFDRELLPEITLPTGLSNWTGPMTREVDWRPNFRNPDRELFASYKSSAGWVDFAAVQYFRSSQDGEIISSENEIFDSDNWIEVDRQVASLAIDGRQLDFVSVHGVRQGDERLVWYWVVANGQIYVNRISVKYAELRSFLSFGQSGSTLLAISTNADDGDDAAAARLRRFVEDASAQSQRCEFEFLLANQCPTSVEPGA